MTLATANSCKLLSCDEGVPCRYVTVITNCNYPMQGAKIKGPSGYACVSRTECLKTVESGKYAAAINKCRLYINCSGLTPVGIILILLACIAVVGCGVYGFIYWARRTNRWDRWMVKLRSYLGADQKLN